MKPEYTATSTCSQYAEMIEVFPWNTATVLEIAHLESRCNPKAYNPESHKTCNGSIGIMQDACMHFNKGENPYDPYTNIKVAYRVYLKAGESFRPWSTCKMILSCS